MIDGIGGITYNTNIRVVIDTNVLISALRSKVGYSYKLLRMTSEESQRIVPCISIPLLYEYEEQMYIRLVPNHMTERDVEVVLNYICSISEEKQIYYLWRPYLKDSEDDHVLEVAIASGSKYIVTFNKRDFVGVESYGIKVVTPKELIIEERW